MRKVKPIRALTAVAATALMAAGAGAACAQSAASAPVRVAAERVIITGRVADIDLAKRTLTLRDSQERELNFRIDPSMKSLDNVKVGDRVQLEYAVAVALALMKGGGDMRQRVEEEASRQSNPGEPPAEAAGRRTTVVADVLSIDRDLGTLRLRGPEGRIRDVKVRDKSRLDEVRTGDQVVAVVDEALALRIQPEKPEGTPKQ